MYVLMMFFISQIQARARSKNIPDSDPLYHNSDLSGPGR